MLSFLFAWRYFKAKKTTNAINVIAWLSVLAMTFGTAALILVLSVFNGFEGIVKSLYSTFYTDLKVFPVSGKVLALSPAQYQHLKTIPGVRDISLVAEEKGIIQHAGIDRNGEEFNFQRAVTIKGVDEHYTNVAGVASHIIRGEFSTGNEEFPFIVLGSGVEDALQTDAVRNIYPLQVYLPKKGITELIDPARNVSAANVNSSGVFSIQQDFDNNYAITDLDLVKSMLGLSDQEYSGIEIAVEPGSNTREVKSRIQEWLGATYKVQTRYEQNRGLYRVMQTEKWVIYAVLVLIMSIFSFTIISALTMLVIEKEKDISILHALGGNRGFIQKIFISEGLLIGLIGGMAGMLLALIIAWLQVNYKLIPLQGGSFLIDYFPVKLRLPDFILVALTVMIIAVLASWVPARKAANQEFSLRSE